MANKTLQLLRNTTTVYATHAAALAGLKTQLGSAADGEPILARYTDKDSKEHTLLGIKSADGYEIFDNAGSQSGAVKSVEYDTTNKKITYTNFDGTTDVVTTATLLTDMNLNSSVAATGEASNRYSVLTGVTQTNGALADKTEVLLAAVAKTGTAADVAVVDSGDKFDSNNVEAVLAEIADKITANTVTSTDGTIEINTEGTNTDLSVNIDGTTLVANASGVISTNLEVAKLTAAEVTALSDANVKEAYKLIYATDADRTAIGDVVKIYKDSSLYSVYLGTMGDTIKSPTDPTVVPGTGDAALCFIYQKADGTYELVKINVESFLQESEFKDGLQVVNHEVSVKVDASSESVTTASDVTSPVLSVSANGVKVDNIQNAINYAVSTLDVTDTAVAGQYVSTVSETDGKISVTRTDISGAVLNNYTKGSDATDVAATDTVNQAISKLENQVDAAESAVSAEATRAGSAETSIDAAVGLTKDSSTEARTYTNTGNYIGQQETNTVATDIKALDTALKTADDAMLTGVAAGNGISVGTKDSKSQTISVKLDSTNNEMLTVGADGLKLSSTWDCGTY